MELHIDRRKESLNGNAAHCDQVPITKIKKVDYPKLLELGRELLIAIGEDPDREGLKDTPRRWADTWKAFIEYQPGNTETVFTGVLIRQVVCVSDIRIYSRCEHHLMDFFCDVSIGYIPDTKILGLSKFARIAKQFAHQLQIQERLGQQIADEVSRIAETEDVAVILQGNHSCMEARGIETSGTMITSVMRGAFRTNSETRKELMDMINSSRLI